MRIKFYISIVVLLYITCSGFLLYGCSGDKKKAIQTGDTLASFTGVDLSGKTFSLASHKDGPVIVRFFLINCPYCKADTPIFNKFYEKYRRQGLKIVYINNNGANTEEVQSFTDDLNIQFPVIYDKKGSIAEQYNIKVQPLTLVLSPEHKLLAALLGGVSEAELNELLDKYFQA
ncbi:MAG: TlpA family protein disulfide reductase [Deltaproteobacteria bacterium]|jgi:peroxiredoxin|nr:TlpA family protein disulfide reductase [Deltaproteobacteria bacterium]